MRARRRRPAVSKIRIGSPLPGPIDGDRVAGDAGLGSGEHPLLAQDPVDQRRLAGIGAPDDRDAKRLVARILALVLVLGKLVLIRQGLAEHLAQRFHQIDDALAMFGREGQRIAEPQPVGFIEARLAGCSLGLVGDEDHRLAGTPDHLGKGLVHRCQAGARIDHEQDDIALGNRGFRLLSHPPGKRGIIGLLEACGIDNGEFQVIEIDIALATVAGDARPIINKRQLAADQAIEQRRLADIGTPDDRDLGPIQGLGHGFFGTGPAVTSAM